MRRGEALRGSEGTACVILFATIPTRHLSSEANLPRAAYFRRLDPRRLSIDAIDYFLHLTLPFFILNIERPGNDGLELTFLADKESSRGSDSSLPVDKILMEETARRVFVGDE